MFGRLRKSKPAADQAQGQAGKQTPVPSNQTQADQEQEMIFLTQAKLPDLKALQSVLQQSGISSGITAPPGAKPNT